MVCPILISPITPKILIPIANGFIISVLDLLRSSFFNSYAYPTMNSLMTSLGMILAFIPYLIVIKNLSSYNEKKNNIKKNKVDEKKQSRSNRSSLSGSSSFSKNELLYYDYSDDYNKVNKYLVIILILIDYLQRMSSSTTFSYFNNKEKLSVIEKNLPTSQILFLFLFSKFICHVIIYKHQICSIILIFIIGLIINCIIYLKPIIPWEVNRFVVLIIIDLIFSLILCCEKNLVTEKSVSPYKLCFIIGLSEFIFSLIYAIISFIKKCDFFLCLLVQENATFDMEQFFKNNDSIVLILVFLLFILLSGLYNILLLLTVNYFSPNHYLITLIIRCIFNFIKNQDIIFDGYIISILVLYFLIFILFTIYCEIVIVKICGLANDTRKEIIERSSTELVNNLELIDDDLVLIGDIEIANN